MNARLLIDAILPQIIIGYCDDGRINQSMANLHTTTSDNNWRYRPDTQVAYWYFHPDEVQRLSLEAWLEKRGYNVSRHVDYSEPIGDKAGKGFHQAHGL